MRTYQIIKYREGDEWVYDVDVIEADSKSIFLEGLDKDEMMLLNIPIPVAPDTTIWQGEPGIEYSILTDGPIDGKYEVTGVNIDTKTITLSEKK